MGNFTVSVAITEFWSVLSAIPLAGGLLCYQGYRYRVATPVMTVFVGTFCMYNFALVSHMSLWKPIFQLTLTSVMTNCFSAFYLYGFLAEDLAYAVPLLANFACEKCRMKVAVPSVALVAFAAIRLPDHIGLSGGVWTLFYVQAPPVWIASIAAVSLMMFSRREELREGYRMVSRAGFFLSLAMLISYFECSIGRNAVLDTMGGFPALHVCIHVSEQIGIYMYGISLAYLHHVHVSPRSGSEFKWLYGGLVPYFLCERDVVAPLKIVQPTLSPKETSAAESGVRPSRSKSPAPKAATLDESEASFGGT